jgi:RNA polymerase-binding transcription factor DksA
MNPVMKEYFRAKLLAWKEELRRESVETIQHLQTSPTARRWRRTIPWSCAPATASAS